MAEINIKEYIKDIETKVVINAVGKDGEVYSELGLWCDINPQGQFVYYELLETSQLQKNLVYSLWFDKDVSILCITKENEFYRLTGKAYRAITAGEEFEKSYIEAQNKYGKDTDLSTVWLIDILKVENQSYSVKKENEKKGHPLLLHLDHIVEDE